MNNIGIGIICFGDEYYYDVTDNKLHTFLKRDIHCYILTDNPEYFNLKYNTPYCHSIKYSRDLKSYHDKLLISKEVLKIHNICILIDSDVIIQDDTFIDDVNEYKFEKGITYIDTLKSHQCKTEFIRDIQMNPENIDWYNYRKYLEKVYPQYGDLETIYEYLIVINKEGLNEDFYSTYEKLQVVKEACDVLSGKKIIIGSAEGVSTHISAKITNTQIQRDQILYNVLEEKIRNQNILK
jgi:hypothetical protein